MECSTAGVGWIALTRVVRSLCWFLQTECFFMWGRAALIVPRCGIGRETSTWCAYGCDIPGDTPKLDVR